MQPGGLQATVDSRRAWERGEETGRQSAGAAARAEVGTAYGEKGLCKNKWDFFFPGPQWTADSNLVEFPTGKNIPREQGLVPVNQPPCWSPRAKVLGSQQSLEREAAGRDNWTGGAPLGELELVPDCGAAGPAALPPQPVVTMAMPSFPWPCGFL